MVIITYLPWHDTFIRFMNVLGELKRTDNGEFQPFLSEAYNKGVPEPGASLKLFYNSGANVNCPAAIEEQKYFDKFCNFIFRILCFNDLHNSSYQVYQKITTSICIIISSMQGT